METREGKIGSPRGQLPRHSPSQNEEKTLGKKRPRRSASSSPKNSKTLESIDDNTIEDSKMAVSPVDATNAVSVSGTEALPATENDTSVPPTAPVITGMGISLPWFESGGPLHKRPPSLLWDSSETKDRSYKGKRKRTETSGDIRLPSRGLWKDSSSVKTHFCGVPIRPKTVGVCEECGIGEEEGNEEGSNGTENVVVLCDGPGCDREFHLKCCRPPLQQVPEDEEFYCFDCHPDGGYATTLLEQYFHEMEDDRDAHNDDLLWEEDDLLAEASFHHENHSNNNMDDGDDHANSRPGKANGKTASPKSRSSKSPATPSRRRRRISQGKKNHESEGTTPITEKNTGGSSDNNDSSGKRRRNVDSVSSKFTFVDKLIYDDMDENQPEFLAQIMNGIDSEAMGKGPPRSELDVFHLSKPQVRNHRKPGKSSDYDHNDDDDDNFLVGCALRLYCPKTNHYHTGRILRIREPPDNRDPNNVVSEDYNRKEDTECLVRFEAGRDHRKRSVTRWIRLEEHSLAVACPNLMWGKFSSVELQGSSNIDENENGKKKKKSPPTKSSSKDRWVPTKLWMRSSRELVMSMLLLEESLGQIAYRDFRQGNSSTANNDSTSISNTPLTKSRSKRSSPQQSSPSNGNNGHKSDLHDFDNKEGATTVSNKNSSDGQLHLQQKWILAECIGREIYKLVHVPTELKEYSPENDPRGSSSHNKKATTTQNLSINPRENEIMFGLVQAEEEARKRVRLWNKLPLQNAWHEKALTSLDEFSLGPLAYDAAYNPTNVYGIDNGADKSDDCNEDGNFKQRTISIEPTPLVRTGLDRIYILEQFVSHWNKTQETNNIFINADNVYGEYPGHSESSIPGMLHGTKDLAISLSCELVNNHCITACIQQQNRMDRIRHDQRKNLEQEQTSELSVRSPSLPMPDAIEANSAASKEGEGMKSVQGLSNGHASKMNGNGEATATGTEPKSAETTLPKNECANALEPQKPPPLSPSPTSSTEIPLLVRNEANTKTGAISVPLSDGVETTLAPHQEKTTSTTVTPSGGFDPKLPPIKTSR